MSSHENVVNYNIIETKQSIVKQYACLMVFAVGNVIQVKTNKLSTIWTQIKLFFCLFV